MACRVGMTTDPEERERFWRNQHRTLHEWKIESRHRSKSAAQAEETRLANLHGCKHGEGGRGPELVTWYVYSFSY